MTAYGFRAARADGATVAGVIDAGSRADAVSVLARRGLYPTVLQERTAPDGWGWRRPPVRALATLMRSLATLVDAGVPLQHALASSAEVTSGALHEAVDRITERVREGSALADAMDQERGLFTAATLGLVRAGERGEGLAAALSGAADQLERRADLTSRLRAALAYPLLLLVVGAVSVAVIAFVIVPRFAVLLGDLGAVLPPATRLLLDVATGLREYGVWIALVAAAAGAGIAALLRRHPDGWQELLIGAPVIGPLRHRLASARVCRTLGALLAAGLPAMAALEAARESAGDRAVAARVGRARERVAEGARLSAALAEARALTPLAVQLAAIGENAGRLPVLLERAAHLEEELAERRLRTLLSVLEPVLILLLAAVVAFVAAALLQAVYSVRPGGV